MGKLNPFADYISVEIVTNQPMSKKTSFGVGGKALYYIEPQSLFVINRLIESAKEKQIPYKIIGNGTNVVFSDKGYEGLIISTRKLKDIFFKRNEVSVMAGASVNSLVDFTKSNSLYGLEYLYGIPATVGGAITMNASCYGVAISDYLTTVSTIKKGKIAVYDKWDCDFNYRHSRFLKGEEVIISATFDLVKGDYDCICEKIKFATERRKESQPQGKSCGSVFKNPDVISAGQLIDSLGLKGYTVGGASVSLKHGNFISLRGDASAQDIYNLVKFIKTRVKELTDIDLMEEVEFIGVF